MPESDTARELADLQSQLAALKARRQSEAQSTEGTQPTSGKGPEGVPEWLADWLDDNGELDPDSIIDALRNSGLEWLEGFNEDLAGAKPSSVLAVFAMGFLVGKLSA